MTESRLCTRKIQVNLKTTFVIDRHSLLIKLKLSFNLIINKVYLSAILFVTLNFDSSKKVNRKKTMDGKKEERIRCNDSL
jgi:hypothetical protein